MVRPSAFQALAVRSASARRADAGFTLIEVVVAIFLIGAVLLTVVGAASAAFQYQASARQEQVATAIATKKMEQIRAIPFDVVAGGMHAASMDADDPNSGGTLASCDGQALPLAEQGPLVLGPSTDLMTALSPYRVEPSDPEALTVDEIEYGWASYVSFPPPPATSPLRATVCVTWEWDGRPQHVMQQSWLWSVDDDICGGRTPALVAGPCIAVTATVPESAILFTMTNPAGTTTTFSFPLAGSSSQATLRDTTTAASSATYVSLPATEASPSPASSAQLEDARASVTADNDDDTSFDASGAITVDPLTQIRTDGTWQKPSADTNLWLFFRPGKAVATALAEGSGSCAGPVAGARFLSWNTLTSACASSSLGRGLSTYWLDSRYDLGDGYYLRPLYSSMPDPSTYGFSFGSYVTAAPAPGGGRVLDARAVRDFGLLYLGGISVVHESSLPTAGQGPNVTIYKDLARLGFDDCVSLTEAASCNGIQSAALLGRTISTDSCSALNAPSASNLTVDPDHPQECHVWYTSSNTPPSPTYRVTYTFSYKLETVSWLAVKEEGEGWVSMRSPSPSVALTITATRYQCRDMKFNYSNQSPYRVSGCKTNEPRPPALPIYSTATSKITINLSLGSSTVALEEIP